MKKKIGTVILLSIIMAVSACAKESGNICAGKGTTGVMDVLSSGMEPETMLSPDPETTMPSFEPTAATTFPLSATEGIDIDLTEMSSSMVYSQVYSMTIDPQSYIGKIVKMKGQFAYYLDEATGVYYFACIVQDATACCAQGLEFALKGEHTFPDDYPKEGEEVCVIGEFATYEEAGYVYFTLKDAEFSS
ncbi:MAG: hypothetical protein IK020_04155 [Clostridiales bacterium]|nr:hypothetical protein [Clostridiales bacterium]